MLPFIVLTFLYTVQAFSGSNIVLVCTKDALYTSLYQHGRQFCSIVLDRPPCEVVTPTEYATYDPAAISSCCSCVLTNRCHDRSTAVSATGSLSKTSWGGISTVSSTSTSYFSTNTSRVDGSLSVSTAPPRTSSTGFTSSTTVTSSLNLTSVDRSSTSLFTTPLSPSTSYRFTNSSTTISHSNTTEGISHTSTTMSVSSDMSSTSQRTDSSSTSVISSTPYLNSSTASATDSTNTQGSTGTSTLSQTNTVNQSSTTESSWSSFSHSVTDSWTLPTITLTPILNSTTSTARFTIPEGNSSWIETSTTSTANITGTMSSSPNAPESSTKTTTSSGPTLTITTSTVTSTTLSFNSTSTYTSSPTVITLVPSLPVANFTQVTRTAVTTEPTCYQFPEDPDTINKRQAVLHNAEIRKRNKTLPSTYIESVNFGTDGIDPVFLTLRDASNGTYRMDVSERNHIAVVDTQQNVMLIDARGLHFSTSTCSYDVSITINNMYQQLEGLSGEICSKIIPNKRMDESSFDQTLYLKDQCGNAIKRTLRKYPTLRIGDSDCIDTEVDASTGKWTFACTFPGSDSGNSKCRAAVNKDILRFLLTDPFGGACPDLSTVVTTLEATAQDFISSESLKEELYKLNLNDTQKEEVDATVEKYSQLWDVFKQALSKARGNALGRGSSFEKYIETYNKYRSFAGDICDDLHDGDLPFNMSLQAGVTTISSITSLKAAPEVNKPFNITIQDSTQIACCKNGRTSSFDGSKGTCAYPANATLGTSGCVCGQTADGASIAFEYMECANFVSECKSDNDCANAGYRKYKCLVGSCCGSGVCFDPFACSQKGVKLI